MKKNILNEIKVKINKKIIPLILIIILLVLLNFLCNNVYAADVKIVCEPKNPRVGDTFVIKVNIVGSDCYSIAFINLDESSNLEYISMDSEKKASGTTPLTGYIQAKYKVKNEGEAYINAKLKIKSASLSNKKLNLDNITEKTVDKKITIDIIEKVKNINEITGKFEVTDDSVNIRPHPSTKYSSLGVYNKGKVIEVTGKTGDWYQFKYNDSEAYMHKDYLKEISIEEKKEEDKEIKEDIVKKEIEEVQDSKVKDPREAKDNTTFLIVFAIIIAIVIVIAIIYLLKQGKTDKEEDNYDFDE